VLRSLTLTSDEWTTPEKLQIDAREQLEVSQQKMKKAYDQHRHDFIHYSVGEIVVMRRAPLHIGESTKLQDKYRGPLVVTEVLPSDVYRVVDLNNNKYSRFATTAHVSQLKSWRLFTEGDEHLSNSDGEPEKDQGGGTESPGPPNGGSLSDIRLYARLCAVKIMD